MDKEEFQAWKDSPATRWVFERLEAKAREIEENLRGQLYFATGGSAQDWADLQAKAGYDRGTVSGLDFVTKLDFEDIDDSEPDRDQADRV